MKVLVTGVFGFIGSYFTKYLLGAPKIGGEKPEELDVSIIGAGRNTNQRNVMRLEKYALDPKLRIMYLDFARDDISDIFEDVEFVLHFGAKTFVDHSIRDPFPFIESNIVGTYRILEEARKCRTLRKFIQFSTDEVYGSISTGAYTEESKLNPTNPYSATKAAGDMLALSYANTYGLPVIITRTENNYGPYQDPQKAMPKFVRNALDSKPLPVYGDGRHRRMWLHVQDTCDALMTLMEKGTTGQIYHIAGAQELENIELARRILKILGKPESLIQLVPDFNVRPGHDRRYALNVEKLKMLGWRSRIDLDTGLNSVVNWYKTNDWWFK